ncbi:discoidin domain-containing protein [Microbulbifer halophilus]|uniref:Discoidin domain-containing protein n=1 Tax=Microbulbifer halophilus TaxID=453963 RepID=A0ABW5E7S4_9GAMM|nr:ThuA domain-containing protein [Microbulbifer halophilus]MCW8125868.1 discoidin domain-containing protein [Microbulbifer halophilus]
MTGNTKYRLVALLLAIALLYWVPSRAAELPRVLLLTGSGENRQQHGYPDWQPELFSRDIARLLEGIAEVEVSEDLSLLNERTLADYELIINNSLFLTPSQEQLDAFFNFIAGGQSYLALDMGLASFLNAPRYRELIGGHLVGGDGPHEYEVFTFDAWYGYDYNDQQQHPVARGQPNFRIHDELFVVQPGTDEIEVIARAENHPVLWWRPWQEGRAMGMALGHKRSAIENPGYRRLLRNSVRWLLGYPIVEQVAEGVFPRGTGEVDDYIDLNRISHLAGDSEGLRYRIAGNSNPQLVQAVVDEAGRVDLAFADGGNGSASLNVEVLSPRGLVGKTAFEVSVRPPGSGNLARYHGVSAVSSSSEVRKYTADPGFVRDGDEGSRWSSNYEDHNWIYLDLGESYRIDKVKLLWEGAYGRDYDIQVSGNEREWSTVHRQPDGDGGVDEIELDPVDARYVRLLARERATRWGYSLYEFEVYGDLPN